MGKVVLVSPSSSSSESEASLVRRNSRLTGNPSDEAQSSRSNRIEIPTLLDEPDREGSGGHLAAPEDPADFLAQFDPLIDLEDAYNTQPQYTEAEDHVEFDVDSVVSWNTEIAAKKTLSTTESVAEVFALCGSGDRPLTYMIPGENERPWNPPRGYVCMYEAYFRQCHLWFPIPSLIISFLNRRRMAFSQLTPAAICSFVAALTFGAEEGYLVNVRCFEEMTTLKAIRSPGYWLVNNRPKHNFLPGEEKDVDGIDTGLVRIFIADGDFIPRTPSLFYLGPAATDADTTECQNFVNQGLLWFVGFLHQDQCRELQYFRTKKRRVDFCLEELETLIAKLKKKRRRVVTRLDEVEQTIRALDIRSEDWEKAACAGRETSLGLCPAGLYAGLGLLPVEHLFGRSRNGSAYVSVRTRAYVSGRKGELECGKKRRTRVWEAKANSSVGSIGELECGKQRRSRVWEAKAISSVGSKEQEKETMAPQTSGAVADQTSTSELESQTPDLYLQTTALEIRMEKIDKDMEWFKAAMGNLLRGQVFGEDRERTPACFASPISVSGGIQQTPGTPDTVADKNPRPGSLPLANPEPNQRPAEGLLPTPPAQQRLEFVGLTTETQFKPIDLPEYEETQKLEQAITALTGTAINWWQIAQYPEKISTWKDFRDKFKVRFKPARGAATIDQLFTIFQRGSVEEYRNRFEEIAVELPHVTDDVLESAFLNGVEFVDTIIEKTMLDVCPSSCQFISDVLSDDVNFAVVESLAFLQFA
ncbi:putative protein [Arabidopsis thaliana]|uniref:Uncharacterized protein T9L3_130 n=1 Tax=Arabidopsis thaliana TaxID=3702 RepID=Q7FB46_ARATH|nr:hypothetical protein T9L3_130 - Arabidopsis thaliana [Arabidopsis thaliana]CAC01882.1 putative protein [Arabidopsis thaliana]